MAWGRYSAIISKLRDRLNRQLKEPCQAFLGGLMKEEGVKALFNLVFGMLKIELTQRNSEKINRIVFIYANRLIEEIYFCNGSESVERIGDGATIYQN